MSYTFDFVGITPVYSFFSHQHDRTNSDPAQRAEYLASHRCTLDAFLSSIETVPQRRGWDLDPIVDTVINFWVNNAEQVRHWKQRLDDAGTENLLVARVANFKALRAEFESLLHDD